MSDKHTQNQPRARRSTSNNSHRGSVRANAARNSRQGGSHASAKHDHILFFAIVVAVAILALAFIVGITSASAKGGVGEEISASSNATNSASNSTAGKTSAATSNNSVATADGYRDNSGAKKTAKGNTAVARVRTEKERRATSDSTNNEKPGPKTVYLTFDDGPSSNTHNILSILDDYGVSATWFAKGDQADLNYVQDIWAEGNQVAIHTYSHDYTGIYSSTSAFWNDLDTAGSAIEKYLGFVPNLTRFPGGSNNSYNGSINSELKSGLASRGYHYFDWNVSSGDGGDHDAQFIVNYVKEQADGCHSCCVLMHDSVAKDTTVEALPSIIEYFIDEGYEFDVLLSNSYGYRF